MVEQEHTIRLDPQKESIKLTKTTKGYTWEIKTMPIGEAIDEMDLNRIEIINDKMKDKFGDFESG